MRAVRKEEKPYDVRKIEVAFALVKRRYDRALETQGFIWKLLKLDYMALSS